MSGMNVAGKILTLWVCGLLWAGPAGAVELKIFVNEPQGGRCSKDIKYVSEVMKEVSNVRVTISPKFMSRAGDPEAPAIMINDELVAENNGPHNGCMDPDLLVQALIERGAVPYSAGYRVISSEQLRKMVDAGSGEVVVIDARNPEEYQEVHIPRSINVPEKKFDEYKHLLPESKKAQLVFYCNGVKCGKSKKAAKKALDLGYRNILVYAEGMPVWEEMNYPIYAGPDYEKKIETTKLSPAEVKAWLDSGAADFTIVDVRDEQEFAEGHIPGALNIPVSRFAVESDRLGKDKKIIVYCNSGGRSYLSYRKLMKLGYEKTFQTIFADWKEAGLKVEKL
jgi:rhodanese-related sulfurtransferase